METLAPIVVIAASIGTICIFVFLHYGKDSFAIWTCFISVTLFTLAVCLYWQGYVFKKAAQDRTPPPPPRNLDIADRGEKSQPKNQKQKEPTFTPKEKPEREKPTFTADAGKVSITLGKNKRVWDVSELKKKPKDPLLFPGKGKVKPLLIYIEDDNLFADCTVYGGEGLPSISVKHNNPSNVPPGWDFNINETALEVVNKEGAPVYQFIYKTKSHVVINGVFPTPSGPFIVDEESIRRASALPVKTHMKRIFKYPSWKYPGQYADD